MLPVILLKEVLVMALLGMAPTGVLLAQKAIHQ
jgi:hypothetical protein